MATLIPGSIVKVQTRNGNWHFGIFSHTDESGAAWFIHNSKRAGHITYDVRKAFAGRRTIYITRIAPIHEADDILDRARSSLGQPYALFSNNCEHFVNHVVHGKRESPQLQAGVTKVSLWALIGTVALAVFSDDGTFVDQNGRLRGPDGRFR